jgi:hypothetical protein
MLRKSCCAAGKAETHPRCWGGRMPGAAVPHPGSGTPGLPGAAPGAPALAAAPAQHQYQMWVAEQQSELMYAMTVSRRGLCSRQWDVACQYSNQFSSAASPSPQQGESPLPACLPVQLLPPPLPLRPQPAPAPASPLPVQHLCRLAHAATGFDVFNIVTAPWPQHNKVLQILPAGLSDRMSLTSRASGRPSCPAAARATRAAMDAACSAAFLLRAAAVYCRHHASNIMRLCCTESWQAR